MVACVQAGKKSCLGVNLQSFYGIEYSSGCFALK